MAVLSDEYMRNRLALFEAGEISIQDISADVGPYLRITETRRENQEVLNSVHRQLRKVVDSFFVGPTTMVELSEEERNERLQIVCLMITMDTSAPNRFCTGRFSYLRRETSWGFSDEERRQYAEALRTYEMHGEEYVALFLDAKEAIRARQGFPRCQIIRSAAVEIQEETTRPPYDIVIQEPGGKTSYAVVRTTMEDSLDRPTLSFSEFSWAKHKREDSRLYLVCGLGQANRQTPDLLLYIDPVGQFLAGTLRLNITPDWW